MSDDEIIAVDPHRASNTAAVLDPVTRTSTDSAVRGRDEGHGPGKVGIRARVML